MDKEAIRIQVEKMVSKEIYELFEVDIVKKVLSDAKIESEKEHYKALMEGHNFKITEQLAPKLYAICQGVKERLDFDEETDFFIVNSPQVNASAFYRIEENHSHIITMNSGLIERFSDAELKFVIGHEIGHLISKNAELGRVIGFIFPDQRAIPLILQNKISLWSKLAELSSDRFGFIASPNLDECVSNFFKLSSGLDTKSIEFDMDAYFKEIDRILDNFKYNASLSSNFHPINPVRVKAIRLFSESKLFETIEKEKKVIPDAELKKEIEQLTRALMVIDDTEIGVHRKHFIASGGLIMANLDEKVTGDELDNIIKYLSNFTIFPTEFLRSIHKSGKLLEIFQQSAQNLIQLNPGERELMFYFLVDMALSDHDLFQKEIDFLYEAGEKIFGIPPMQSAQLISSSIRKSFIPKIYNE